MTQEFAETVATLYGLLRSDYEVDLTHQSVRVLQFIATANTPPRIDEIRRFLGIAPTSASELIKRLAAKGMVDRQRSTDDERVVELTLTPQGASALRQHTQMDVEKIERALRHAPGIQLDTVTAALKTLLASAKNIHKA